MHKSKLVRTFQVLTPAEAKRLQLFLKSPFYNANSNVVKLYNILFKHCPAFDSPKLSKEAVFQKLFPGRPYAHQQLLNLMSTFFTLLEKYLVALQLERKELEQKKLLVEAYEQRPKSYNYFKKEIGLLHKRFDELPYRDEKYFHEKTILYLKHYRHPETNRRTDENNTLYKAVENFEMQKRLTDVKLKCAVNARMNTIKEKRETIFNNFSGQENKLIVLYDKLAIFQKNELAEDFKKLVEAFKSNIDLLRKEDKGNILKILLNYCGRQSNKGHSEIWPKYFNLYKIGLTYDCLIINGKMTGDTFQNIVAIGSSCQEFEWVQSFIDMHQDKLEAQNKEGVLALSFGVYHLEKKEFQKAIDAVQLTFDSPINNVKSKSIMIRAWFELWREDESYFDLLWNKLEAFEKLIRRDNSIYANLKTAFLKFVFYTKKTMKAGDNESEKSNIKKQIIAEPALVSKKWLLEKQ